MSAYHGINVKIQEGELGTSHLHWDGRETNGCFPLDSNRIDRSFPMLTMYITVTLLLSLSCLNSTHLCRQDSKSLAECMFSKGAESLYLSASSCCICTRNLARGWVAVWNVRNAFRDLIVHQKCRLCSLWILNLRLKMFEALIFEVEVFLGIFMDILAFWNKKGSFRSQLNQINLCTVGSMFWMLLAHCDLHLRDFSLSGNR
jgi:hypothetical protein